MPRWRQARTRRATLREIRETEPDFPTPAVQVRAAVARVRRVAAAVQQLLTG